MTDPNFNHRYAVLCFLSGKIEEMQYQLSEVVSHSDISLACFKNNEQVSMYDARKICFSFSAFANVLQTLKDIAENLLGDQKPIASIRALRHGPFMLETRNAMTHDGNPIIDAWVDGLYYVPAKILRFGRNGKLVTIQAPKEDIRTLCLEFSVDICAYLRALIEAKKENPEESPLLDNSQKVNEFMNSSVVPEFVRKIFAEHSIELLKKIDDYRPDPLQAALLSIRRLETFCAEAIHT